MVVQHRGLKYMCLFTQISSNNNFHMRISDSKHNSRSVVNNVEPVTHLHQFKLLYNFRRTR